jgi:murein DD-endopeptidase MepM/ murein hydrolase activator NlpD
MNRTHHANLQTRRRALGALGSSPRSLSALLAACGTTPTEPAPDGFYRVERGDTLYSIARRNKRSVSELARWNNMSNTNQIEVGQLIRVRPPGGAPHRRRRRRSPTSPRVPSRTCRRQAAGQFDQPAMASRWPCLGRFAPPAEKGMRIEVPAGGKVRAAAPGWAIHVGTLRGYGMLVIVKHNDDWLTVYGNLDKPLVKEGDRVTAGQEIGSMAQAAELHFEVRGNGRPLNPANYLPSRG